jgi:Adenylate and Guanylate cyclase catalytic domain
MESLGQPGRIHMSQATADAIIAAGGKKEWLILREDTVFAKGKGNMQTYWFSPNYDTRTVVTNSGESMRSTSGHEFVPSTPASAPQDAENRTIPTDDWV